MVNFRMIRQDSNDVIGLGKVKWSNIGNRVVVL